MFGAKLTGGLNFWVTGWGLGGTVSTDCSPDGLCMTNLMALNRGKLARCREVKLMTFLVWAS